MTLKKNSFLASSSSQNLLELSQSHSPAILLCTPLFILHSHMVGFVNVSASCAALQTCAVDYILLRRQKKKEFFTAQSLPKFLISIAFDSFTVTHVSFVGAFLRRQQWKKQGREENSAKKKREKLQKNESKIQPKISRKV
jgi:hypothetical protein